jgi:hypothetical protein
MFDCDAYLDAEASRWEKDLEEFLERRRKKMKQEEQWVEAGLCEFGAPLWRSPGGRVEHGMADRRCECSGEVWVDGESDNLS